MDGPWKIVNPWMEQYFTQDQIDEIRFCRLYEARFKHIGTEGHSTKMIIAQLADKLDAIHFRLGPVGKSDIEIVKLMGHKDEL